jgi:shikimate kinase
MGVAFVDLDACILDACAESSSVADIFAREGEAGFRRREAETLDQAVAGDGVLALGGGTVVSARNRALLHAHGWRIFVLQASVPTLRARIGADGGRPLLNDLEALVTARADAYRAAGEAVATDGLTMNEVVEVLLARMGRR